MQENNTQAHSNEHTHTQAAAVTSTEQIRVKQSQCRLSPAMHLLLYTRQAPQDNAMAKTGVFSLSGSLLKRMIQLVNADNLHGLRALIKDADVLSPGLYLTNGITLT